MLRIGKVEVKIKKIEKQQRKFVRKPKIEF